MANLGQIKKFLNSKKIPYGIIDLGEKIYRVDEVAKAGVNVDEIVKTLVVRNERDTIKGITRDYIALVLRGRDRVDFKKVRRMFNGKVEMASGEEIKKQVGVPIGAVCPIEIGMPLYFDKRVMELKNVNMGSGDLTKGLDMKFSDLKKAVGEFKITDLIQH